VVAEGVETLGQLDRLREMGCRFGQGYYFSRPLTPEAAGTLLTQAVDRVILDVPRGATAAAAAPPVRPKAEPVRT
jgi:predicted signal transduction protein with EAL and GGDEF domain